MSATLLPGRMLCLEEIAAAADLANDEAASIAGIAFIVKACWNAGK